MLELKAQATFQCQCHHEPTWLEQEFLAGRLFHEYRENADGVVVLICLKCGGLWDHSATDRLIDFIMYRNPA
jgi:hypothetical protein